MKKNLLLFFMLFFLALSSAFSQNRTITGTVTSATDGLPLPGVVVRVKGTTTAVSTNNNGKFSVNAASSSTLVFSFIGYATLEIPASSNLSNVKLTEDTRQLNEVVVVGYGTGVKASNVVGNVAVVSAKDIADKPVANAFDALQGKVAGLQILSSSGAPTATPSLSLHGNGSLGANSTPLIVLDGIPIDPGTVLSLNPDDFESITVLKDASATSIYGSRAANGVLYMTTKKGSTNKPATVSITGQYAINRIANPTYFQSFMNRAQVIGFFNDVNAVSATTGFAESNPATTIAGLDVKDADTQWYKTYYKDNVPTYNTNIAISGGGGKTSYYTSAGFYRQDGLAYRSAYKRYTLRSNINSVVNDYITVGVNLSMGYDDRQSNPYGSNSTNRGLGLLALPYFSPKDAAGNNYAFIPGWGRYHPEYLANENPDPNNNTQLNPTAYLQITPFKGLTIKTQGGVDAYDYRESSIRLPSYLANPNNGTVTEYFTRGISKTFTNTIEYKFDVTPLHHFTVLGGQEQYDGSTTAFQAGSVGFTDDRLLTLGNGSSTGITDASSKTEFSFKSLFGRLDYIFNDKYLLEGSIRQDKSSRFGVNKRTGVFWSAGASWKAKKESFLKNVTWLDDLDIKFSTGSTGNASIGNYLAQATAGSINYNGATGLGIGSAGNQDLSWETQHLTTVGFSASIFDRIRIEASYYLRKTTDMLIPVPYALTTGFSSVTQNTGALQNTGVDLRIEADVYTNRLHKAYITPYINASTNKDKITKLFQDRQYYIIPNTGISWAVGQPVTFLYPIWAGVNPSNGLPQWYLPNTDPAQIVNTRKDPNAITNTFNATTLQQSTGIRRYPWSQGGFGLSAGYEGFSLQADFIYVAGKYLIDNDRYFFENPNQFPGFNQIATVLDYWKNPGDNTQFPKLGQQFTQFDSRLIEDASFMRMKNLTIGYSLPQSLLARTKAFKGAKFFFTGRNLLTVTKYRGVDPEVDSNLALGTDPNTKQYSFGAQLTF